MGRATAGTAARTRATTRMKLQRLALFHWESRPDCAAAAERLDRELRGAGFLVVRDQRQFDPRRIDAVVLLGGDGFLLNSLHALGYPPTPFYGLNFGSVGFLMNPTDGLSGVASLLKESRFHEERHPVLDARVALTSGGEETCLAINDFILERSGGQSVRLQVLVGGVLFNEFSGDGVIIATAAGSTAYNLAAGGPVIHPAIPAVTVTPLYPHRAAPFDSLQFPVLLPLETSLRVVGSDIEKRPIRLLADGRPIEGVAEVVVRDSGKRIHLLRNESHEFIATLARKFIGHGE